MLQPDWRGQVEECGGPAESLPDAVTGQLSLVGRYRVISYARPGCGSDPRSGSGIDRHLRT